MIARLGVEEDWFDEKKENTIYKTINDIWE